MMDYWLVLTAICGGSMFLAIVLARHERKIAPMPPLQARLIDDDNPYQSPMN